MLFCTLATATVTVVIFSTKSEFLYINTYIKNITDRQSFLSVYGRYLRENLLLGDYQNNIT